MKSKFFISSTLIILLISCHVTSNKNIRNEISKDAKPNVLLIIVDDEDAKMNELMHDQIKTPTFAKLSQSSTLFTSAHCAVPACAPSRTALLTGVAAHNSGAYYNNHNLWATNSPYKDIDNLPGYFKKHGYLTACFGKVYHNGHDELTKEDWSDGYYYPYNGGLNIKLKDKVKNRIKVFSDMWSIGKLPNDWDLNDTTKMQQDTKNALRAIDIVKEANENPFFIALGIYKPHVPYYVPEHFFDMYPLDSIQLPKGFLENDLDDVPNCAKWAATRRGFHDTITNRNIWKEVIQAKMASITYTDEQIGRVINALENGPNKDNTIIVWIGDNGFHTGQKNHWSKFALWEKATQVPMLIKLPNQEKPIKIDEPVSLLDVYPTLVEACDLAKPETHKLDGLSILNILRGETNLRGKPVISTHGKNNHAVITKEYHYISYRNGAEELYDKENDPFQWNNLINTENSKTVVDKLKMYLPKTNVDNLPFLYGDEASKGWSEDAWEMSKD